MRWEEKYSVGDVVIDTQHKHWFSLCEQLGDLIDLKADDGCAAINAAYQHLKDFSLEHFADEEAVMREVGYAGYAQHKAEHEAFKAFVLKTEVEGMLTSDAAENLHHYIAKWIKLHVLMHDQKYKTYLPKANRSCADDAGHRSRRRQNVFARVPQARYGR